jgi:hypothetical protein
MESRLQTPINTRAIQSLYYDGANPSLPLNVPTPRPPRLPPINNPIKPHQRPRRQRHQPRARSKQSHPSRRAQHIEDRVRVELVVSVALLDPEPIPKSYERGQAESGEDGDGVRRREEQEVEDEREGGDEVEGEVVAEEQDGGPGGEDEGCIDLLGVVSALMVSSLI